jgi:hypothetical protein
MREAWLCSRKLGCIVDKIDLKKISSVHYKEERIEKKKRRRIYLKKGEKKLAPSLPGQEKGAETETEEIRARGEGDKK